jgi:hypothetical protein
MRRMVSVRIAIAAAIVVLDGGVARAAGSTQNWMLRYAGKPLAAVRAALGHPLREGPMAGDYAFSGKKFRCEEVDVYADPTVAAIGVRFQGDLSWQDALKRAGFATAGLAAKTRSFELSSGGSRTIHGIRGVRGMPAGWTLAVATSRGTTTVALKKR